MLKSGLETVYHRLMYGLRHVQHRIGKLTAYLNLEGIQLNHWKGQASKAPSCPASGHDGRAT